MFGMLERVLLCRVDPDRETHFILLKQSMSGLGQIRSPATLTAISSLLLV